MRSIDTSIKTDLFLGYECNNNCLFCYVADRKKKQPEKTASQAKKDLDKAREKGSDQLHFVGGEPTIRDDILDLVSYAKKLGYKKISVTTNGRMFCYENFTKKMISAGLNNVIISVHGPNSKIHDELTQSKGSFDQIMKGIDNLKGTGVFLEANVCITKINYKFLPEIAKLLINHGFNSCEFMMVHPRGNAGKNYDAIVPQMSEIVDYLHEAIRLSIGIKTEILARYVPFCFLGKYKKYTTELFESFENLHIAPDYVEKDAWASRRDRATIKSETCRTCRFDNICLGAHREHTGVERLYKPIPGKKYASREEFLIEQGEKNSVRRCKKKKE
ncbi:radical SAM protein [Candidatus Woesearchaeota archaeon]|nr:radical SAM protein [Candidatus Woesearchaeota archaeon]